MRAVMTALLAAGLAAGLSLPAAARLYLPRDARANVGREITVRGTVDGVRQDGKLMYLFLGGRMPDPGLTVAIYPTAADVYGNSFTFPGKTVEVTGVVKMINGRPTIEAHDMAEVFVKD